jgi:hypothetical protein
MLEGSPDENSSTVFWMSASHLLALRDFILVVRVLLISSPWRCKATVSVLLHGTLFPRSLDPCDVSVGYRAIQILNRDPLHVIKRGFLGGSIEYLAVREHRSRPHIATFNEYV